MDLASSSFDGVPVAFEISGSGSLTIVFIHGLVGDHTDFDSQIAYFARTHKVLAVDLPGSGESGRDRSSWTMESFGEDVATVVDRLGLDEVVLVGHSLGGNVTVEAALRLSGRVRGLVWVSSFRSLDSVQSASKMEAWFAPFNIDFPAAMDDLNRRNFGPNADPALVEAVTIVSDIGETLWVFEDVFRCADNSGSFTLRGEVPLNDSNRHLPATSGQAFDGGDDGPISDLEGTWTITAGTGDYGSLEGGGTMVMDFSPDYVESYEGKLNEADE